MLEQQGPREAVVFSDHIILDSPPSAPISGVTRRSTAPPAHGYHGYHGNCTMATPEIPTTNGGSLTTHGMQALSGPQGSLRRRAAGVREMQEGWRALRLSHDAQAFGRRLCARCCKSELLQGQPLHLGRSELFMPYTKKENISQRTNPSCLAIKCSYLCYEAGS